MQDNFTKTDIALLGSALAAIHADIKTTKDVLSAERGRERNPILGARPTKEKLNQWGMIAGLGAALAAITLPKEYGRPLLGAITGMELSLAQQNKAVIKHRTHSNDPLFKDFKAAMKKPLLIGALSGLLTHMALGEDSGVSLNADKQSVALGYTRKF